MPPQIFVLLTVPSKGVGTVWAAQSAISELILADLKQAEALTSLSCLENEGSDGRREEVRESKSQPNKQKPCAYFKLERLNMNPTGTGSTPCLKCTFIIVM